jgi:outer membrane protein assembly factor BamB
LLAAFALLASAACGTAAPVLVPAAAGTSAAAPGPTAPLARPGKEPVFSACKEAAKEAGPDPVSKLVPAWRWSREDGGAGFDGAVASLSRAGNLLLVERADGAWATADGETGTHCAGAVPGPKAVVRPTITPDLVIGLDDKGIVALAPRSLAVKWSFPLASLLAGNGRERALDVRDRTRLRVVGSGGAVFAAVPAVRTLPTGFRWEVTGLAVDVATGRELWRKTVVTGDVNENWSAEADLRLHDDGVRLMVEAKGLLRSFDARTGRSLWSTPLPVARELARERRVLARGDKVVITPRDAPPSLRDAATGKAAGGFDLRGRVTDAVAVGGGSLVLAVEQRPGAAEVVRVDASGAVRWRHVAERSVLRLRAEGGVVHALEGSGRLVLLEAQTGVARGAVSLGAATGVELVKAAGGTRALVVDGGDVVAYDLPREPRPAPLAPFLAWTFAQGKQGDYAPTALAWVDAEDRLAWTQALPPHVRDGFGRLDATDIASHANRPRFEPFMHASLFGILESDDALAIGHAEGVWVVRRKDGGTVLDHVAGKPLYRIDFDDGTYAINGTSQCTGRARGAKVFTRCGSDMVWFDGARAALVDAKTWQVRAESVLTQAPSSLGRGRRQAELEIGGRRLRVEGAVFMR